MQPQPEHSVKSFYCYRIRSRTYISVETTRIYARRSGFATVYSKQISCDGMSQCGLFPTMRFPGGEGVGAAVPPVTGCPAIDPPAKAQK
jgi:hypothetical protein